MSLAIEESRHATRERLLSVAERLFAENGFDAVSLRAITREAEVNVAAVNYHFQGKQGLVEAVIMQHVRPVNEKRRAGMAALRSETQTLSVKQILRVFFQPFVEHVAASEQSEMLLMKFMARVADTQNTNMPEAMALDLRDVITGCVELLSECLEGVPKSEIWKRLHFTFGAFCNTMLHGEMMKDISGDQLENVTIETLMDEVIDFAAAGFKALLVKEER